MNIFVLHENPFVSAKMHCNQHAIKMCCEYAQLLSTTHRILDGTEHEVPVQTAKGVKIKKVNILHGECTTVKVDEHGKNKIEIINNKCYAETHRNHPCNVWLRESDANYYWLVLLLEGLFNEFEERYKKVHASKKFLPFLKNPPKNIKIGNRTEFVTAMPEEYIVPNDAVQSYRNFYIGSKSRFATWPSKLAPDWYTAGSK